MANTPAKGHQGSPPGSARRDVLVQPRRHLARGVPTPNTPGAPLSAQPQRGSPSSCGVAPPPLPASSRPRRATGRSCNRRCATCTCRRTRTRATSGVTGAAGCGLHGERGAPVRPLCATGPACPQLAATVRDAGRGGGRRDTRPPAPPAAPPHLPAPLPAAPPPLPAPPRSPPPSSPSPPLPAFPHAYCTQAGTSWVRVPRPPPPSTRRPPAPPPPDSLGSYRAVQPALNPLVSTLGKEEVRGRRGTPGESGEGAGPGVGMATGKAVCGFRVRTCKCPRSDGAGRS